MNNKKIIILMITLVGLLVIGVANAADVDVNDTGKLSAGDDDEIVSVENDLDVLSADSLGSYSELVDEISKPGNIVLKYKNYTYDSSEAISIGENNKIIDGNGSTIDMAGSNVRAFNVTAFNVTIKNLTIKNANSTGNGGAIYFSSSGTVINCNFTNNTVTNGRGGAILFGSYGSVTNCNFNANQATGEYSLGGAIFFLEGGNVTNCNFSGNKATYYGGAVCFWNYLEEELRQVGFQEYEINNLGLANFEYSIENCNFTGNNASTGSAIYFYGTASHKTVSNSCFLDNRANAEDLQVTKKNENNITIAFAGNDNLLNAIYSGGDVSFTNVTYWSANGIANTGSSAVKPSRSNKGAGQNITIEIYDSKENLVDNVTLVTDDNGQVTYDLSQLSNGNYTCNAYHIEDCYYTYREYKDIGDFNRLQNYINAADANSILTLYRDYTFTIGLDENLTDGVVIDKPLTINGNGHTINATGKARIFYVIASSINITGLTFKNGNASGSGGAILWMSNNANISNCYFINNTAQHGGANCFMKKLLNSSINAVFINNNALNGNGGANYFSDSLNNVFLIGNFINNIGYLGGANFFYSVSNSNINSTFINNTAMFGGANYFCFLTNNVSITGNYNCNTAQWSGGANLFESLTNVKIMGNYSSNFAQNDGGANCFFNSLTNVTITGDYMDNTANATEVYFDPVTGRYIRGGGGANCFMDSLDNVNIIGNYIHNTAQHGGANFFDCKDEFLNYGINNVAISGNYINNKALSIIHIVNSTQNNVVKNSIFINNTGLNIEVKNGNLLEVNNWFGNNASNYDVNMTHSKGGVVIDNWLFLNATANPSEIEIKENSTILFELKSYSKSGIEDYDASKMNVRLDLSNTLGKLNQSAAQIGKGVLYTAKQIGNASVTGKLETASCTVALKNKIIPTEISITNSTVNLTVFEIVASGATLSPADAGNLTYISSNETVAKVENGQIIGVAAGNATITVSFAGDSQYAAAQNKTITVFVTLNDASISVDPKSLEMKVGESCELNPMTDPKGLDFTVKSSNSSVAKVIIVNSVPKVTAIGEGNATITFTIFNSTYFKNSTELSVTVKKANLTIKATAEPIILGENVTVVITGLENATGNVSIRAGDGIYNDTVSMGTATVVIPGLIVNTTAEVRYLGDSKYNKAFTEIVIVVNPKPKENATIIIDAPPIEVGENATVTVTLPSDAIGNVTIGNEVVSLINGIASAVLTNLPAGNTTVPITYSGDEKYNPIETSVNVTVKLNGASVSVNNNALDLFVDDTFNLVATTEPKGLTVNFTSCNSSVVTVDKEGNVVAVSEGTATINVSVGGDGIYLKNSTTVTVTVIKVPTEITVDSASLDLFVGDETVIVASLTPADAGNVTFTSSDDSVVIVDAEGNVIAAGEGSANITVSFAGNDKYVAAANKTVTVTVLKQNTAVDIEMPTNITVGENSTVNVKLPSDATGDVTVSVDCNEVVTVPLTKGSANITMPSLSAGNHTVEIVYSGDDKYNPVSETKEITVSKNDASPEIAVDDETVNVKLPSDASGNVTVKVDGETVSTVPVTEGSASVKLPKLSAGNHTVEIAYSGDDKYNPSTKTTVVSVDEDTTILTAKNVTATYKVDKYLTITLTDSTGSPIANATVTVVLKTSKNYTTDDDGQVKVKVSNLVPKTYTAQITFVGNGKYNGSNTTVKVTVKKATPKMAAKKKAFKTTAKNKKYAITLKNKNGKAIKNAKVTLKVKGKTYTAKTNSKGKATFNLKKLNKKGSYNAVIKYNGSKYYKKLTKKSKITVYSGFKTISRGSSNHAMVKKIQRALKANGYYLSYNGHYLKVDGIYEIYTEGAVKQFQNNNGLKITGKVDEKTALKLGII